VLHLIHFFQLLYSAKGDSVNDFFNIDRVCGIDNIISYPLF
jgi:hypothetical protein